MIFFPAMNSLTAHLTLSNDAFRLPFGDLFGPNIPDRPVLILLSILILFLLINILLVLTVLYISNSSKNRRDHYIRRFREYYEEVIRSHLFGETGWEETRNRLRKKLKRINRKLLISVLLEFQENLRGGPDTRIPDIYYDMGLYKDSLRNVRASSYVRKIGGLRELTNLYPEGAREIVWRYINHPNSLIRDEAQNSYMRLYPDKPFDFLRRLRGDFTGWTQLSAFYLFRLHALPVPDFGDYLQTGNPNVRNFCLRMIIFFQQIENAPAVIEMVAHPQQTTRNLILRAINDLRLYDAREIIRDRYACETRRNRLEIIRALRNIGTTEDFRFLEEIIRTGTVTERTEACRSLYYMNTEGPEYLESLESDPELQIGLYLAHITDPRN
jgi:hypothetical protein